MKTKHFFGIVAVLSLAACAVPNPMDIKATEIIKRDFRDKGIIKATAVNQDELQAMCSKYDDKVPTGLKNELEAEQLKSIKWPADGKYMGDLKAGETLAQSGRGKTWSDKAEDPAGGNCYNCHSQSGNLCV